jgi:dUTP pyrophosphatase
MSDQDQSGFFAIGTHGLPLPERATAGAAGYDLRTLFDCELWPHDSKLVSTGYGVVLPPWTVGLIRDRSGMAVKGITTRAGVIDADYRGELKIVLVNESDSRIELKAGDRIAQMIILPCDPRTLGAIPLPDATERGAGGFGSTGVR